MRLDRKFREYEAAGCSEQHAWLRSQREQGREQPAGSAGSI